MTAASRPPHYRRVRALLDAFDVPVVELWGWPGSAKRAILRGLLEDEPGAEHVPAAWLREPERLEERVSSRFGRRAALLICEDRGDDATIDRLASLLAPGQRLLIASDRRLALAGGALATAPEQLLLRPDEIGELWSSITGRKLSAADCEAIHRKSDGWHFPLAVWARDPAVALAAFADAGPDLHAVDAIAPFVRDRVLAALAPDETKLAVELARAGGLRWSDVEAGTSPPGRWQESTLRSMIERLGWPLRRGDELVLPRLLQDYLAAAPTSPAATRESRNWRDERNEPAPDVRIGLLGVPRVERRDDSGRLGAVEWSFKRPLRILAYLASAPDLQASREEIVSILWPESSEDTIRRNLHPALSWLRRSVWPRGEAGRVVLLRDGVYSLDPALHWEVDVRRFLERIEDGARHLARGRSEEAEASWESAWRLYQGPFLQGWSERWVLAQRDELQLRFTDLLRRLGDLKAQHGRLTEAEDAYRTLLLEDPLEEGVHVAIMRIYAERGRRDLVNRQYERLRQVLRQELAVEPSAPTLEAWNELMQASDLRRQR